MILILFIIFIISSVAYLSASSLKELIRFYWLAWKFTSPKGLPIFGTAFDFLGPTEEQTTKLDNFCVQIPSPFGLWNAAFFSVIVHKREDFEILLKNPAAFRKSYVYTGFKYIINKGMLCNNDVVDYKTNKKHLVRSLTPAITDFYIDVYHKHALVFCGQVEEYLGQIIDVRKLVHENYLHLLAEVLFEKELTKEETDEFNASLGKIVKTIYEDMPFLLALPPQLFMWRSKWHEFRKAVDSFNHIVNEKITYCQTNYCKNAFSEIWFKFSEGNNHPQRYVQDEIKTFLIGGTDTTASTTTFTLMALGAHQDVQEKVLAEIREVLLDEDRSFTSSDIQKLVYLECVIKETLRILPVVGNLARRTTEEIKLGKYTIPKDCEVYFNIFRLHRDPNVWKDPLTFNPDRFKHEEFSKLPPFSYMAWSAGARSCPGLRTSLVSNKLFLATILKKFKITTPYKSIFDIEPDGVFSNNAKKGNLVCFTKRNLF